MHQLQRRGQAQAALTGKRGCCQHRAVAVIAAGEADADLVAAEDRVVLGGLTGVMLLNRGRILGGVVLFFFLCCFFVATER